MTAKGLQLPAADGSAATLQRGRVELEPFLPTRPALTHRADHS